MVVHGPSTNRAKIWSNLEFQRPRDGLIEDRKASRIGDARAFEVDRLVQIEVETDADPCPATGSHLGHRGSVEQDRAFSIPRQADDVAHAFGRYGISVERVIALRMERQQPGRGRKLE